MHLIATKLHLAITLPFICKNLHLAITGLHLEMGILRFFYYVYKNYSSSIISIPKRYNQGQSPQIKGGCDYFGIDINAIIHPCVQEFLKQITEDECTLPVGQDEVRWERSQDCKDYEKLYPQMFESICNKIKELTYIASPRIQLYLAIDGVSGSSKQSQQRKRRFKSYTSTEEKKDTCSTPFDMNSLSCGTEFMKKLSKYIENFIISQLKSVWKHLEIVFSSDMVNGEGEHKIVRHFANLNPSYKYVIYSPDADLIMLTLPLSLPNMYILRKNIYDNIDVDYFLVDINSLKREIIGDMKWDSKNSPDTPFNENSCIRDFILMCFCLGNDFLPSIESISIAHKGLEYMLGIYPSIKAHFTTIEGTQISLNYVSLKLFFSKILDKEIDFLLERFSDSRIKFPDQLLIKYVYTENKQLLLNFDDYRFDYYEIKNQVNTDEEIDQMCYEYFKGLKFVLEYYCFKIPDTRWLYPYHYAPFACDLVDKCTSKMFERVNKPFIYRDFAHPHLALLSILPIKSINLLPEQLRPVMLNRPELFDHSKLVIDVEGKINDYEAIICCPQIDTEMMEQYLKEQKIILDINILDKQKTYRIKKRL